MDSVAITTVVVPGVSRPAALSWYSPTSTSRPARHYFPRLAAGLGRLHAALRDRRLGVRFAPLRRCRPRYLPSLLLGSNGALHLRLHPACCGRDSACAGMTWRWAAGGVALSLWNRAARGQPASSGWILDSSLSPGSRGGVGAALLFVLLLPLRAPEKLRSPSPCWPCLWRCGRC